MSKFPSLSTVSRIRGLSALLLFFLLIVILYSLSTLQTIEKEMHELTKVDIPLNEKINEIEILQIKHHLLMEVSESKYFKNTEIQKHLGLKNNIKESIEHQIVRIRLALKIIEQGIANEHIAVVQTAHISAIDSIKRLDQLYSDYKNYLAILPFKNKNLSIEQWNHAKQLDTQLDNEVEALLLKLEEVTKEVSIYTNKHLQQFVIINFILGLCALIIGSIMTQYIISSFRKTFSRIHDHLETIRGSLADSDVEDVPVQDEAKKDELRYLEKNLQTLSENLSQELINRKDAENKLLELATKDRLTGAYNRHRWEEQLTHELKIASRGGLLGVLVLDVDHFKKVNDSYGHDVGDKVLIKLAREITNELRETDLLYRLGGEEFAVLIRGQSKEQLLHCAEQLKAYISNINFPKIDHITLSIGITSYKPNDTENTFFKRADIALYEAKADGRNKVKFA